jgi:hypothetical protein
MGVRDDDGVRGNMRGRRLNMMDLRVLMRAPTVNRQLGVEFTYEIQWATKKG